MPPSCAQDPIFAEKLVLPLNLPCLIRRLAEQVWPQLASLFMSITVEPTSRCVICARRLVADYLPTAKNGIVKELYSTLGFTCAPDPPSGAGSTRWLLDLDDYVTHETHITRSAK